LSYETDPNAKLPPEIEELGRFLETRGNEILRLYETTGRTQQSTELKERLRKAMAAKKQLEKIALLDFNKPSEHLKEVAQQFGLDLHDPSIKTELKKIQAQNLTYIRDWIDAMNGNTASSLSTNQESSNSSQPTNDTAGSANVVSSGGNNYFINNNYYSSTVNNNSSYVSNYLTNNIFPTHDLTHSSRCKPNVPDNCREAKTMSKPESVDSSKLITDIIKNINKYNEEEKKNSLI